MPASNETALRSFLARFLGWADEHKGAVEHALRSIETDFVPIAHQGQASRQAPDPWAPSDGVPAPIGPMPTSTPRTTRLGGAVLLTLDISVLETLLKHAAAAARLVGYIDGGVDGAIAAGPLGDHVDAIVHMLSELLGNPDLIAAPVPSARSSFPPDAVVPLDGVPELAAPDAPTVSRTHTLSLIADGALRHDLGSAPEPAELVTAFTEDEATRPHVRRLRPTHDHVEKVPTAIATEAVPATAWQARAPRALAIEDARSATRWVRVRGTTVMLVGLVLRVLGACGGAR